MPIRGSPNGARHPRPQAGRDRPEWVVAINRNAWSQSIGIAGRDRPVRARGSAGRAADKVGAFVGKDRKANKERVLGASRGILDDRLHDAGIVAQLLARDRAH
jgi:hypothetical protein